MIDNYLKETEMLDYSNPAIQELIQKKKWKELDEFERIKGIYNFVRDDILFGYNEADAFCASKVCLMAMANVIQKGPYLWLFYELVRFHVEFMVSQLIKDFKKEP